jgi:hypothetical protein
LRVAAIPLVLVAFGATASVASARHVNIVRQGDPPKVKIPANVHYFTTIQEAVNASVRGDWVLIEPGTYDEEVKVTGEHPGIKIRGMDRNSVIVDGQHISKPEGRNGIEILKTNGVSVENLTVRNFDRPSANGPGGNEVWWNGGDGSGVIGEHRWRGNYLTAYDDELNGGYGLFASNAVTGSLENSYASGFNDSGLYIGACRNCNARVFNVVMENNALGYSGSNAGGRLLIEHSVFSHNAVGFAPNSENPGDPPPPQDGACNSGMNRNPTPTFKTTEIERCTIFRNNVVQENNNINTPGNPSSEAAPWGVGVELPGVYADLIEKNTIKNNPNVGVFGFEYPNPFPPGPETIYFQFAANRISDNVFSGNGTGGGTYAGDLAMEGGAFGQMKSTNNCVSGNSFTAPTYPAKVEETWGCQHSTTPNPEEFGEIAYILELQAQSEARTPTPQPVPPAQPTMPNPCQGVPYNPLCQ